MSSLFIINLIINATCLALSFLGLIFVLTNRMPDRVTRSFFLAFFCVLMAYSLASLLADMDEVVLYPHHGLISRLCVFALSLFSSLLTLLITGFLLYCCGEDWKRSPAMWIVEGLWSAYLLLLILTQFTTFIYYYDEGGIYHRGPWYPLLLVPTLLIMAADVVVLWRRRGQLTHKQRNAFACYLLIPAVSMLIQMVAFGLHTIVLGTTVSSFLLFAYIFSDLTERFYQKEREVTALKTDVMLSQIQPHFLYNVLGAIQGLCRTDPAAAEQAVAKFSRYLRGNTSSLSQSKMIPFEQELAHTRLFLELEQLRYEDALQVSFCLGPRDFFLPPLTLQPLVENAVRHGVRQNPEGRGTITVSTAVFYDRFEITVTDDGPGISPTPAAGDGAHIAIGNVRERLKLIAGGQLVLHSTPGTGTTATILLPRRKESQC